MSVVNPYGESIKKNNYCATPMSLDELEALWTNGCSRRERCMIAWILKNIHNWKADKIARSMGVSRTTTYRLLREVDASFVEMCRDHLPTPE